MVALTGKLYTIVYFIMQKGFVHVCARFSRKVLWLEVAKTNNNSAVIAGYYLKAVFKYGTDVIIIF